MKAPYKAIEYIIENSCKYAEAKAQRIYLEEFRKTKKALLMKDAMARGIDSAVAQEREADAHIEYADLLRGLMVAIEKSKALTLIPIERSVEGEPEPERPGIKYSPALT